MATRLKPNLSTSAEQTPALPTWYINMNGPAKEEKMPAEEEKVAVPAGEREEW